MHGQAAIDSGVARIHISREEYLNQLAERMGMTAQFMRTMEQKARQNPLRIVFAEGEDERVLRAVQVVVDEGLAQGRLGVIDVGTYTTDYVLVDRLRYIERGSGTIATAMSKAYQLIGRSILDTYGLELRMHQVDRVVREGRVTVFGEARSVDWLADPVFDAIAQEILAEAGTLWGDGRDLKAILRKFPDIIPRNMS